ncbi:MAG TPA: hypothetical protein PLY88_04525 [Candidatus Omnitrophota bacterium]|nr:hypothetical protein [Candidatus Omnitrophota bacterium]HRK61798.1 hypothetical protein [Candidatus Omnitrophota bacterium]
MRNFKNIFLLLVIFLCVAPLSWAALPDDRKLEPTVDQMIESLNQQIDLTEEQVDKIRPIFEYNLKKREKFYVREKRGANKKKLRQEVRALRTEIEARIAEVLTPEQKEKLKVFSPPVNNH